METVQQLHRQSVGVSTQRTVAGANVYRTGTAGTTLVVWLRTRTVANSRAQRVRISFLHALGGT